MVLAGADLSEVTFGHGAQKDKLVYTAGEATPIEGFSCYGIDTDTTVTLVSDLEISEISGGGTVELNGYSLTGAAAVNAEVKSVSLRPGAAGLYFTGEFQSTAGAVYGIALSTEDETPVAEDNTNSLYTVGYNSVLVKDIMKAGSKDNKTNANKSVYARAYVKLSDGTTVYGTTAAVTLKQLVLAADAQWAGLTAAQQNALKAMYEIFASDMAFWKIPNIKA